ncbi:MAG: phage portal protein [Alphaproteobacteria bacterium]|nr:phage portal protein [Alphaproteobacteria bacterium]
MAHAQQRTAREHNLLTRWLGGAFGRKKLAHTQKNAGAAWAAGAPFRSYMVMPGQAVWMDRDYSRFAEEAYARNVIAHRAIAMVSAAAASVRIELMATNSRGVRRELSSHPLLTLIRQPNPSQSMADFFGALYHYRLISGNVFVQAIAPRDGLPAELHLLRPDRVSIVAGKAALPSAYRYTVGDKIMEFPVDRLTGRSSVLHLKNFHPLNDWYGLSPVEAAAYSIDQHNHAAAWNQSLMQNGARPSGALVVRSEGASGGSLSEDQYSRLKTQIDEQFSGSANAGRPILLEGGLDWKEMSLSPKDMDFIEAKNSAARDIALAFGVPPQLLGIPGDNRYANLQEARLALWEQTVIPLLESTVSSLSGWLGAFFGQGLELIANTDDVPVLALRNQTIWDRVERASFLTEDEKRAAVGYPPKTEL